MKLKEYLVNKGVGSLVNLAKTLHQPPSIISYWANGKRVPKAEYCVQIEQATNGAVTRKDLRPDDWHLIWPELADKD